MSMADAQGDTGPLLKRSLWATSLGGLFSLGYNQLIGLIVPLYLVSLGMSPLWIGVVLSARSALSLLYAIHLGKVIDIIGARRAMLVFSGLGVGLSLMYPLFHHVGALIVLQLLCGIVAAMCWMGSQTAITRLSQGEPRIMALFSFAANAGNFVAPLAVGFIWDTGGTWPAFIFTSCWLLGMLAATLVLPARHRPEQRTPITIGIFSPRLGSYLAAGRLLRVPAVRFVMCMTFLRIACIVVQESFYAVLLGSKGFSAATIGVLIGIGWLVSTPAALLTPPAIRRFGSESVLLVSTSISIVAIAATSVLDSLPLLVLAASLFGMGHGLGFSLIISGAVRSFPPGDLGLSVGLRSTVNRAAGFVIPLVMGGIAQWVGLPTAFWLTGAILFAALAAVALSHRKQGLLGSDNAL